MEPNNFQDRLMDLEDNEYLNNIKEKTAKQKVSLDSFLMLSVIGLGSYAKVTLVKKKDNGNIYALKVLKKKKLQKPKQKEHLKTERDMLVSNF